MKILMMGLVLGMCLSVTKAPVRWDASHTISVLVDGQVQETSMEEYLVQVLMSELTMSFQPEAMKAQAVASRTFALHCQKHPEAQVCGDSACCQAWGDWETIRARCGKYFDGFYAAARQAVRSTDGEILTYGEEPIDAVFFACSGGKTESAQAVWGNAVPYLQSVDSPGEEAAECFSSTVTLTPEEFAQSIPLPLPEAPPSQWIGEVTYTQGGSVETAMICGVPMEGTRLRALFHLNSACFTLAWQEDRFVFSVRGAGHRVGMSQWGAQAMALEGKGYREILSHYYPGTQLLTQGLKMPEYILGMFYSRAFPSAWRGMHRG